MGKKIRTFDEIKSDIDNSLTDATKCYILVNYVYNTEEYDKKYKDEFAKRFINFYKTIVKVENELDDMFLKDNSDIFKRILNIDYYKPNMKFLDSVDLGNELEEKDDSVDIDYEVKASMSVSKLNFYHNNRVEFGNNTRFHVDTDKCSAIDPKARSEEEKVFIFMALTDYFKNNYLDKSNKDIKILKKNM